MHDIDRTLTELESEYDGEFESELEAEGDAELEGDAFGELETGGDNGEFEFEFEAEDNEGVALNSEEELELASELLNVSSEAELDQFLGKVFRKVKRTVGGVVRAGRKFLKTGVGRRLGGILKGLAKKALPIAGTAIGGFFGGPAGAALGGRLAPAAGRIFGLELEGLSPEDQEFETARRFVRLAATATANAAQGSQTAAGPQQIVRSALVKAARRHAPGLLRSGASPMAASPTGIRSGRWVRRGNRIILLGV